MFSGTGFVLVGSYVARRCDMTNQERLALADRVQKNIQKEYIHFQIFRRKEQIEKEYNRNSDARKN